MKIVYLTINIVKTISMAILSITSFYWMMRNIKRERAY